MLEANSFATHDSLDGLEVFHFRGLNGARTRQAGTFWTPSLQDLRREVDADLADMCKNNGDCGGRVSLQHLAVDDVRMLLEDPSRTGSVFQVASQFNCLEMISPHVSPEDGISRYAFDPTQGPACATACAPGTAFRNYLVEVPNHVERGQSKDRQINCFQDVDDVLTSLIGGAKSNRLDDGRQPRWTVSAVRTVAVPVVTTARAVV